MGLPSRVAGKQTLMYTSPHEYMNPLLRGVKVCDTQNAAGPCI